jgi:hypothetical protein
VEQLFLLPAGGRSIHCGLVLGCLLVMPGGLVLVRAEVAEFLLDALGVVPAIDVREQGVLGLVAGAPLAAIDEFDLQCDQTFSISALS